MTSSPDYYRFVACPNPECRLRFPGVEQVACPLCKTTTVLASDRCRPRAPEAAAAGQDLALLLDNVRSVFNVGSIFRSADGCGCGPIYLCGITPTPDHAAMRKTALGAEKTIKWTQHNNSLELAQELVGEGKVLWALEYTETSIDLRSAALECRPSNLVLVLGNEVTGVDPDVLALCQRTVHIPMRGHKASLNVATAAGIAAYALCESVD
jgi:23S rRNA (guanosine2251-2'-O)-methyltransferase